MKRLFYISAALFWLWSIAPSSGQSLQLAVESIGTDTVVIRWGQIPETWKAQRLEIYIREAFLHEFPEGQAVDTLPPGAKGWYFPKRKGIDILGMDLRDPREAGRKDRWTSGEVYTFGLRVLFPDTLTGKLMERRFFTHVLPFHLQKSPPEGFQKLAAPGSDALRYLPASAENFVEQDEFHLNDSPNQPTIADQIRALGETPNAFVLEMASGNYVVYQKAPKRPLFLGNFTLLILLCSGLILVFTGPLLIRFYFKSLSASYARQIMHAEDWEEQKTIIRKILHRRFFAIPTLFALLRFQKPGLHDETILFQKLRKEIRPFRLFQKTQISAAVETLLESGEIEQARKENKASYHVHVEGNENIVLTNLNSSEVNIEKNSSKEE